MRSTEDAYLRRLEDELRDLPGGRRRELIDEIRGHIDEAAPADEAELREVLDRLGDPEDIAAEARERFGVEPRGMGLQEIVALVLLPIGAIVVPVVGWVVGVVLLWGSTAWSYRDKLIGTLLFPGGLALPLYMLLGGVGGYYCEVDETGERCYGEPSDLERGLLIGVLVLGTAGTIFSVAYLARRARRGAH